MDGREFDSKAIFVVHGHDTGIKESVARMIDKLGLETIILHEKPNAGRTIIEKLESYSNVGFAVILLSPDDVGRSAREKELKARARQNVIAELGFFIGKLGRERVCSLYMDGVEIPSDFDGVLYVLYDNGGNWRFKLVRELKAAGYKIDANKII